ncbi:hypothetical protein Bca52824_006596 [Brassica carinata]|uniref:Wall-associated receptor kinase galacturonan-binding domain-containing protein n=1 Tax=Brassica carinata TaxID=52824 RepID=A0A8X7W4N6_BRACI|nr:hypothetical protein Bca52824_006596 [Brassica carinata]
MNTKTYNILCIIASVLTLLISNSSAATPPNSNSSSSCSRTCGGISIPFPFGIGGKDCYLNNWYEVVCNSTSGSGITVPFLSRLNMEVVNIILPDYQPYGVVHVKGPVTLMKLGMLVRLLQPPCSMMHHQHPMFSRLFPNERGDNRPKHCIVYTSI